MTEGIWGLATAFIEQYTSIKNKTMNAFLPLVLINDSPLFLRGCKDKPIAGRTRLPQSKKGFAKNREEVLALRGKVLKVWGYVDGGNVFPKDWGS